MTSRDEPLRLVVWDETDSGIFRVASRNRERHDGRGGTSRATFGLSPWWKLGGSLHGLTRRAQSIPFRSRGVSSWQETFAWAASVSREEGRPIAELQAWGHGGWGFMDLADSRLDRNALSRARGTRLAPELDAFRDALADDGLLWLRCCSAFGGHAGRAFAPAIADRLRREVAAHTYVIHVLQSGTHVVSPGAVADWPVSEGVITKDGEPVSAKNSNFGEPRTLSCLRADLPLSYRS